MSEELSETTRVQLRDAECRVDDALKALRKAEFEADWLVTNAKRDYLEAQRELEKFRVQTRKDKYGQIYVHVTKAPVEEVVAELKRAIERGGV